MSAFIHAAMHVGHPQISSAADCLFMFVNVHISDCVNNFGRYNILFHCGNHVTYLEVFNSIRHDPDFNAAVC